MSWERAVRSNEMLSLWGRRFKAINSLSVHVVLEVNSFVYAHICKFAPVVSRDRLSGNCYTFWRQLEVGDFFCKIAMADAEANGEWPVPDLPPVTVSPVDKNPVDKNPVDFTAIRILIIISVLVMF